MRHVATGESDARRHERDHLAGAANGQTTHPLNAVRVDIAMPLDDLDTHFHIGVLHEHFLILERAAKHSPYQLIELHGIDLEIGVIAPRLDFEGLKRWNIRERFDSRFIHDLKILLAAISARNTRYAGDTRDQINELARLLIGCALLFEQADPARDTLDARNRRITQYRFDVGDELLLEVSAILTFKTDLVVVNKTNTLFRHGIPLQNRG